MINKSIFIFFLIIFNLGIGFSQEKFQNNSNDFGITLGLTEYQVSEKVLNNIRHHGIFPSLGFSYEWSKEITKQKIELYLIFNMLKSRYDPDNNSFVINPSLNYSHVWKIKDINPKLELFIGGICGLYSHQAFFGNWDDSHIYWLTYYYLGLDAVLNYQNSVNSIFSLEINFPLLALVSRPPERFLYKVVNDKFSWIVNEIHSNLRLTSIHQHFVMNMKLGYLFSYTDLFKQRLYLRLLYSNTSMSNSKGISILTYTLGSTFLF